MLPSNFPAGDGAPPAPAHWGPVTSAAQPSCLLEGPQAVCIKTADPLWPGRELCHRCAAVQLPSHVHLFATPWIAALQPLLPSAISRGLLKVMAIESVMPSNHLILCRPLLLSLSVFPSIRVFSKVSTPHIRWPKYRTISFSIGPSSEYSGFISFRIDWFGLLAVQGILKGLLQHHSSKVSILQCSAYFMVQFSHPYMTSGKPYL